MEYFKVSLRPHKAVKNAAYCESLIWESFNILRKSGQVYENFHVVTEDGGYAVYVIMPGADALDLDFCTEESVEIIKKLAAIFSLKVEALGGSVSCEDSCECEAPTWYMLYTDLATEESPVVCGDCGKPVPLYKLPAILDKEGQSNFLNWQDQFKALQKLDIYNYNPSFTAAEIYAPDSRINKMGRALCRALEKAKSVPVFYHLEVKKDAADRCPLCGREWSRTANEDVAGKLCTFCRIAVD
jgi:predicted  nucleic acid-binding Zn ribbon protein